MTLLEWLDRYPPCLARLAARQGQGKGQKRLTHQQIAERSGLSVSQICVLSRRTTWKNIPPQTIDAFMKGCGASHFALAEEFRALRDRRNKFTYLKRLSGQTLRLYSRLQKLVKRKADERRAERGPEGDPLFSPPSTELPPPRRD